MPVFRGDPNFWQALDNSFSSENIKKVQAAIKDRITNVDSKELEIL
jgi:hypothetical protein